MNKKLLMDNKNALLQFDFTDINTGRNTTVNFSNYDIDGSIVVSGTWWGTIKLTKGLITGRTYRLSVIIASDYFPGRVGVGFADRRSEPNQLKQIFTTGKIVWDFVAKQDWQYIILYVGKYSNIKLIEI